MSFIQIQGNKHTSTYRYTCIKKVRSEKEFKNTHKDSVLILFYTININIMKFYMQKKKKKEQTENILENFGEPT